MLCEETKDEIKKQIDEVLSNFKTQISLLNKIENTLYDMYYQLDNFEIETFKQKINKFNDYYNDYKNSFSNNFTLNYIENKVNNLNESETSLTDEEKILEESIIPNIKDNRILLISEIQNKVILPYKVSDLKEYLINDDTLDNYQEVIDKIFTLPLTNFEHSISSRFKEAFYLMRKKEKSSLFDTLDLALELSFNSLLNPAIISACRNLDELDIYLDCLKSNELDSFKFFDIKYELYPAKK